MKLADIVPAILTVAILMTPACAREESEHEGRGSATTQPAGQEVHIGEGKVNAIDTAAGQFNITHGPIPSLKWPAMTMDIPVHPKLLDQVQKGDQVRFQLQKVGPTAYQIVGIEVLER
jgi:Cu/Ag efflux protein CusF